GHRIGSCLHPGQVSVLAEAQGVVREYHQIFLVFVQCSAEIGGAEAGDSLLESRTSRSSIEGRPAGGRIVPPSALLEEPQPEPLEVAVVNASSFEVLEGMGAVTQHVLKSGPVECIL